MPLPLIPLLLGGASAAAAALGIKKGLDAREMVNDARRTGERAQDDYKNANDQLNTHMDNENKKLAELGQYKKEVFLESLGYIVDQVKNARSKVKGFDIELNINDEKNIENFKLIIDEIRAIDILAPGVKSGVNAIIGAYGFGGIARSGITALTSSGVSTALAGTGVVTTLTGTGVVTFAGTSAALSAPGILGAGSIATTGLSTALIGGIVAGPAIAVTGFVLASKAEEAQTQAWAYRAKVDKALEEFKKVHALLDGISGNMTEVKAALSNLMASFNLIRSEYESSPLKKDWLQRLIAIAKAIKEVVEAPILDEGGVAFKGLQVKIQGSLEVADSVLSELPRN